MSTIEFPSGNIPVGYVWNSPNGQRWVMQTSGWAEVPPNSTPVADPDEGKHYHTDPVTEDRLPLYLAQSLIDLLAARTYVDSQIAAFVDAAPGALDTLNELAAALGDDPNFATTVLNAVALKADIAHDHTFASLTSKPTTLAGYGITDAMTSAAITAALALKSGTGHVHTFASLTSKPTTLAGYNITDAMTASVINAALALKSGTDHVHTFASLTSKPTTIAGYGITDANIISTVTYIISKTLVIENLGQRLIMDAATDLTVTIPLNATVAFPVNSVIHIKRGGAGNVTIAGAVGVTIESAGDAVTIADTNAMVSLIQDSVDVWSLVGALA